MLEAKTSTEFRFMTRNDSAAVAPAHERFNDASGSESAVVRALVQSAASGDRQAFDGLYEIYAPLVHGVLLARVPYGEVGDLAQDVFLVAFRKLGSLRDSSRFGPWLAMIARNRATDFHRRRRETENLSEGIAQVLAPPRAEAEEALETIRGLPEAYRETLVLRLVEGMTGPEIAERTGLQPESVRVNLHRGMKLLREKLGVKGREA
jgi:RNA polymerase sigma-70 factor (ECF subfamily)